VRAGHPRMILVSSMCSRPRSRPEIGRTPGPGAGMQGQQDAVLDGSGLLHRSPGSCSCMQGPHRILG
jgi:hypothetical protein